MTARVGRAARLLAAARQVVANAHAPYSKFPVGAAVEDEQGRIFTGANVENASYGLTICAERAAVFAAVSAGAKRIIAYAVHSPKSSPLAPCGACRQVMAEFSGPDAPVFLESSSGAISRTTLGRLLPRPFKAKAGGL